MKKPKTPVRLSTVVSQRNVGTLFGYPVFTSGKPFVKKKINKFSEEEILIRKGWFVSLQNVADRFEKNPTDENKHILLGFISSAKFIVERL